MDEIKRLVELKTAFHEKYSYIYVDDAILTNYFTFGRYDRNASQEMILDWARDYVLSQQLADDVEL